MFTAELDSEGGRWVIMHPESGWTRTLGGKEATLFRLLLAIQKYDLRPDIRLLDLFTEDPLERGRGLP